MNLYEHVDQYCERVSTAFWAEPVNALSNLSFAVAAWAIWRMLVRHRAGPAGRKAPLSIAFTVPLAASISLGSFAFHTLGTRWAQVLDVAPIALFVLWFLGSYLHWFHGLSRRRAFLGVVAFIAFLAAFIAVVGPYVPNRSGTYVPVLLLLAALTVVLRTSRDPGLRVHAGTFGLATVSFTGALLARTADESVCSDFPVGTHFLWHLLDGLVVYLASLALVRHWRTRTSAAPGPVPAEGAERAPGPR
ncbi:ceramidase domain-containing protein [Streptomyces roseolus]|uniref:ceramidase domain-containing protein n=1 Tax=Streptomyces roseolus TaxID=67358 RepID=UPI0036569650